MDVYIDGQIGKDGWMDGGMDKYIPQNHFFIKGSGVNLHDNYE